MEKIEHELAALRARAATLHSRHKAAEAAFIDAETKLQRHLLEADLDADEKVRTKLETTIAACAVTRDNFAKALAVQPAKVAEAEAKIAAQRAVIERNAAADKLARDLDEIDKALPAYQTAARQLADAVEAVAHFHFEANELGAVARNWAAQIDVAGALALVELRQMVEQIKTGAAAIPLKPAPASVANVEAPPPTMTLFMLKSARYRDNDGRKRFAGQFDDATMPAATAQRALRLGIAVATADPRRAQLRGMRGGDFAPQAPDVIDLDAVEEANNTSGLGADSILRQAGFVEIDRSAEARTIQIAVPRM
ncbi:hypothetical protein [Bradyrhizobium sp. UFLA05-112]